jgi:hypothetical protein
VDLAKSRKSALKRAALRLAKYFGTMPVCWMNQSMPCRPLENPKAKDMEVLFDLGSVSI